MHAQAELYRTVPEHADAYVGTLVGAFVVAGQVLAGAVVASVTGILIDLAGAELAGANGATQDDDGEEEAEEGNGAVAARPLDLTESAMSETCQHY